MRVSFIIPAYNEERVIGRCLASVEKEIERSGVEAEVVVADNGSTDRTREIAASHPRVRVIEEPWKGANRARQAAFRAAHGELVASIDADTIVPEKWLKGALAAFETEPKLVALSGPFTYYDLPVVYRACVMLFYGGGYLLYLFNRFVLRHGSMIQGGNLVARRSALERIGGYDTSIEFYGDDTALARELSRIGIVRWSWRHTILASGRRLAYEGIVRTGWRYALNHFSVLYLGRPVTSRYLDVRPKE